MTSPLPIEYDSLHLLGLEKSSCSMQSDYDPPFLVIVTTQVDDGAIWCFSTLPPRAEIGGGGAASKIKYSISSYSSVDRDFRPWSWVTGWDILRRIF